MFEKVRIECEPEWAQVTIREAGSGEAASASGKEVAFRDRLIKLSAYLLDQCCALAKRPLLSIYAQMGVHWGIRHLDRRNSLHKRAAYANKAD